MEKKNSDIVLKAEKVTKIFGSFKAVSDADIEVKSSEVVCIIGPSGSGKSTFLRCMNFLDEYDSGEVYVHGQLIGYEKFNGRIRRDTEKNIDRIRQKIGMVFQGFNLWPHKTALGNVTEALKRAKKMTREAANKNGYLMLEKVGLKDKAGQYPSSLSGGEQQRVAIARALALEPEVLLFDEPTSALDPELVGEVLNVIEQLAKEDVTMVIVTHEMGFAYEVADKIVFMEKGNIVEVGSAEQIFKKPEDERLQAFLTTWINRNKAIQTVLA